jgi:hypothetical protein
MYNKFEAEGIKEKILTQIALEKRIVEKHLDVLDIVGDIVKFVLKK